MRVGVLDFLVSYFAPTANQCVTSNTIVAKCDITQNDTQLTTALRQAVADAVNATTSNGISPAISANDVVGCNI